MSEETTPTDTAGLKHGFYATYSNHGCRCDECRTAHNAWHRQYRNTDNGRRRTMAANRKSRLVQQRSTAYLREHNPEAFAAILAEVETEVSQ